MQLKKQLSAISHQSSAKSRQKWQFLPTTYLLQTTYSQKGVGLYLVIAMVALAMLGAIVLTTPQIRQAIFPAPKTTKPEASTSATPQYSEKQRLYLRNEEVIKKNLNLTQEQFDLLVENAGKN